MKMHHIDDFKCTLCSNWFCPPYNLPYLLPCTHSICTRCIQKISQSKQHTIICPEDLESCSLKQLHINTTTKKALQRLMKQHKNYNKNTQLQCIKTLSLSFDEILSTKQKHLKNLEILIDQVFANQIERLKKLNKKLKTEINRPTRIVEDWKEIVTLYLTNLKQNHRDKDTNSTQMFHYIEEGRKIKMELMEFFNYNLDRIANDIVKNPIKCLTQNYELFSPEYKQSRSSLTSQNPPRQSIQISYNQNINKINNHTHAPSTEVMNIKIRDHKKKQPQNRFYEQHIWRYSQSNLNSQSKQKSSPLVRPQKENIQKIIKPTPLGGLKDLSNLPIQFQRDQNTVNIKQKTMKIGSNKKQTFQELLMGSEDQNLSKDSYNEKEYSRNSSIRKLNKQNSAQKEMSLSQFHLYSQNDLSDYYKEYEGRETMKNIRKSYGRKEKNQSQYKLRNKNVKQKQEIQLLKDIDGFATIHQKPNNSRISNNNSHSRNASLLLISPGVIKQKYTEQGEEYQQYLDNDELLIANQRNQLHPHNYEHPQALSKHIQEKNVSPWIVGNHNFLKQWKIKREKQEDQLEVKQKGFYNCQKQKSTYTRKMQMLRAQEAFKLTIRQENYIEVINESLLDVDMNIYLSMFQWPEIQIIKFVRTSLTDQQLNVLLNFIVNSKVKALVLSGNNLTDISLDAFLHFVDINKTVKNVYLPKNYINILKNKAKINLLKQKGINIYI